MAYINWGYQGGTNHRQVTIELDLPFHGSLQDIVGVLEHTVGSSVTVVFFDPRNADMSTMSQILRRLGDHRCFVGPVDDTETSAFWRP